MITKVWNTICQLLSQQPRSQTAVNPSNNNEGDRDRFVLFHSQPTQKNNLFRIQQSDSSFEEKKQKEYQLYDTTVDKVRPEEDVCEGAIFDLKQLAQQVENCDKAFKQMKAVEEKCIKDNDLSLPKPAANNPEHNQQLFQQFKKDIQEVIDLKYVKELQDYPQISLKDYTQIKSIWQHRKKNSDVYKQVKLQSMMNKLTYATLATLKQGTWLNDEIVNGYIELMERQLSKRDSKCKILDSFFVTTTLTKSPNVIERILEKKKVRKDHALIFPVNCSQHWFFLKVDNYRIYVYDSLSKEKEEAYESNNIILNVKSFTKWYYGTEYLVELCDDFPQQKNGYDCGVFMLFGIKDTVRENPWSFQQRDIRYKRVLLCKELIEETISGFGQQIK